MKGICPAIRTGDMEKSLRFYVEGIGYSEHRRMCPSDSVTLVFLKDDSDGMLEIIGSNDSVKNSSGQNSSPVSIVISVDKLADTLEKLSSIGYQPKNEPFRAPSGEYIAFITDPDGIEVELIENFNG